MIQTTHDEQVPNALIIDDEKDICYLLGNILKQQNFDVKFAGSLRETDKFLHSSEDFSFIFLDNKLPDGSGISYIRRLKKRFPSTKVIMISAYDTKTDQEYAQKKGVDDFIGKPFTREKILGSIDIID
jgi:DNA-binding response OmpR family regulator